MITKQQHNGFIRIEEYSLAAWLAEVETVINQGYTFDFESNDTHPHAFGSMYTVLVVPVKVKDIKETTEITTDVAPSATVEDTPVEPSVEIPVQVVQSSQTKRKNAKS